MKYNFILISIFYIKNFNEDEIFQSLTVFYRGLKHELVTDFSGRDRLLSHELLMYF